MSLVAAGGDRFRIKELVPQFELADGNIVGFIEVTQGAPSGMTV